MNILLFTLLVGFGSMLAGFLGALTGLGGGVVLVPMLALIFHIDIRYAMGASLVSVIATSSGAAAAYVREGYSNIRIGMFLEVATTLGAVGGAWLAAHVSSSLIAVVFGLVLIYSAYLSKNPKDDRHTNAPTDPLAQKFHLDGSYPTHDGPRFYKVRNIPGGFILMWIAGLLSGLLGIGSGAVKVLAMDQMMQVPFKVSTTTSNFMIGVTAAASAGIYLSHGYIDPRLAMPVMLGVLGGSMVGAKALLKSEIHNLRLVFSVVILALGFEMLFQGITGKL